MARTQFSAQVYDQKNTRELRHVKSRIVRAYDALCKEAGVVGTATGWSDPNKQFKLSDYPNAQKKIEKLLEGLAGEIQSIITDGIDNAWELSHQKNSAMVQSLANTYGWSEARANALSRRNLASLAAFKARTQAGMHLSDRVWDFVKHDRQKIEWALELGLAEGKSAAALSRDVRQYLNEPNKLFRRVKNKHGQLVLSQAAKAYHPGQGVYRSSYKNALRLAATETNMAYRTADHEAWQKMPFVIGQEVKLSDVHATSDTQGKKYPVRYADMCDELAGVYPKDFKFTGWHPHCRCYVVAKLASRDELTKYSQLTDEQQKNYHFEGEVRETPKQYKDWIVANEQRIANASSTPYFIKENAHYTDEALHPDKYQVKQLVLQYDVVDKLNAFREYAANHEGSKKFQAALDDALKAQLGGDEKAFYEAMGEMAKVKATNERVAKYLKDKKKVAQNQTKNPVKDASKITAEEKHRIYELPLNEQFVEMFQGQFPHKIYRHVLKGVTEEDFNRLVNAAKVYAKETDVLILPEIHKSETGIRGRLGIKTENKVPDLITGYGLIDAKSPKNIMNVINNANKASAQGAIACISNDRCEIKVSQLRKIAKDVYRDPNYKQTEIHFIVDGVLYKYNGQGILLGQGLPASQAGYNGYISLRNAKIEYINDSTKRTISKKALLAKKQAILEREARKKQQLIQDAATKRHAARTPEREKELREFWDNRKAESKQLREDIKAAIKAGKNIEDAKDPSKALQDLIDGKIGATKVLSTGKSATACMEKMREATGNVKAVVEEFNSVMSEVKTIAKQLQKIPDIDLSTILNANSINLAKDGRSVLQDLKRDIDCLNKMNLQQQKDLLEDYIKNTRYGFAKNALNKKLDNVKIDIKIEELTPDLTSMLTASAGSNVSYFKDITAKAQSAISSRDVMTAEKLINESKAVKVVADQYDGLVALNYTSSGKFTKALNDGLDFLNKGDLQKARDKFDEAAQIKLVNDTNVARRKAREEAAKRAEEEAKRNAEEAAAAAKKKPKKLPGQAENIDEVREIMGEDTPILLKHYEKSIARDQYTEETYKKNHADIESNLKKFFEKSKFAHCDDISIFDERVLDNGILTTHQLHDPKNTKRDSGYDQSRRAYEHFAYGYQSSRSTAVSMDKRLDPGQYYRCGAPVPDDLTLAYEKFKARGYGDAQVMLRKERIVTTFTYGNSLQTDCIPSLTNDPKVCSIDKHYMSAFKGKIPTHQQVVNDCGYIEIQFLPKSSEGRLMPRDMESITFPRHPEKIINRKEIWERWKKEGVDIYYWDSSKGKVVLYQKGDPIDSIPAKYNETAAEKKKRQANAKARAAKRHEERDKILKKQGLTANDQIAKLIEQRANDMVVAGNYAKDFLAKKTELMNKDLDKSLFKEVEDLAKKGNVFGARKKAIEIEEIIKKQKAELAQYSDLLPDVDKWHKNFTIAEIKEAHEKVSGYIKWIENKYPGRNDPDQMIDKLLKDAKRAEDPTLINKSMSDRSKFWEIEKAAYLKKRDDLIFRYRHTSIQNNIKTLESFDTKDKAFKKSIAEIKEQVKAGKWGKVEDLVNAAKEKMRELEQKNATGRVIKLGDCGQVVFSKEDFEQARKDAAKWFRCKNETSAQIRKAFKEADDYMSQYAEEMWKNLTQEEKHILWLYTDGSKYITDEMLKTYQLHKKSWIDRSMRNGLEDANVLTSIIEKAPALRDDIWMQSGKSKAAFKSIFGKNIEYMKDNNDLASLVGTEGYSSVFMSCHSARDGHFTKDHSTGSSNDIVLTIYMPKGTKGVYCEPFASYGDSKRGAAGYEWDGTKQKEAPSDQVEFLLQRGAKFRITKAVYDPVKRKWFVDVDLIEQTAQTAVNTTIRGLDNRPVGFKAPTT